MISVVSPVYNAAKILPVLVHELVKTFEELQEDYEIVLVDDRSPDDSWQVMKNLQKKHNHLKVFRLSRNFGQHPTIMAGLSQVKGDWIVVMDCDMQDQPKEIKKLFQKAKEGFDVVLGRRVDRQDGFFKKLSSSIFSFFYTFFTGIKYDNQIVNFGIYNYKVIQSIVSIDDYISFFPLFVKFVGYKTISIDIEHAERLEGNSSYNFYKLVSLAFNNIISYSNLPLKQFIKLGLFVSILSFFIGIYYFYLYMTGEIVVIGFTSLVLSIWFLSGLIITTIGIVGVYVGKIFDQTKNRPKFIIDED